MQVLLVVNWNKLSWLIILCRVSL